MGLRLFEVDRPQTPCALDHDALHGCHMNSSSGGMVRIVGYYAKADWRMTGNDGHAEVAASNKADKDMTHCRALQRWDRMAVASDTSRFGRLDTAYGHIASDDRVLHKTWCLCSMEKEIHIWFL